jgi:hypothetical protein
MNAEGPQPKNFTTDGQQITTWQKDEGKRIEPGKWAPLLGFLTGDRRENGGNWFTGGIFNRGWDRMKN